MNLRRSQFAGRSLLFPGNPSPVGTAIHEDVPFHGNFFPVVRLSSLPAWPRWSLGWLLILALGCLVSNTGMAATVPVAAPVTGEDPAMPHFSVRGFTVEGRLDLSTNMLTKIFSKYSGTNVSLLQLVQAASDLELECLHRGYPTMNVVLTTKRITNGIVTLNVFPGAVPQIVVAGRRYAVSDDEVALAMHRPFKPKAAEFTNAVPATNAVPHFAVKGYQVEGNTLLPPKTISMILTNVPDAFGTNVSFERIQKVVTDLRAAYRDRGFTTVYVGLPPQRLTNASVKVQVVEGRLSAIVVKGNHYYSSNNIMRAMPGLTTNMILNAQTFQAEVNRANANQDRQISGVIEPGPDPGTSDLILQVKDRLPVHGKIELNNDSSPGTPDLRVNSSAVYDNLWQLDQALGVQYSFSPEQYKQGNEWKFYDLPSVANYSTFYRIPLGNPEAIDDQIAAQPGSFGYDEATHKFNLPPATGQPDLTLFASRSTIDEGLTSTSKRLYTATTTNSDNSITTNSTLDLDNNHQDITVNNDFGFRLNYPLLTTVSGVHMAVSGGLDFKTYEATSVGTNIYLLNSEIVDTLTGGTPTTNYNKSSDTATQPRTLNQVYYLPLALRYDVTWHDPLGNGAVGVGMSADLWDRAVNETVSYGSYVSTNKTTGVVTTNTTSGSNLSGTKALQAITDSKESTGHWVAFTPSVSHTFQVVTNWVTTFRADGQWASEPLISNEQFGAGGVNSVPGYQEGDQFGDAGWRLGLEQQTPPHLVGMIDGHIPVILRGTVFMDYARVYLLDAQGRQADVALWGTGAGWVFSIGSWWQARFLFSFPLLSTSDTTAYHPYFNFSLTGQF